MEDKQIKVRVVRQFLANVGPLGQSVAVKITPKGKTDELPEDVVEAVKMVEPPVIEIIK